MGNGSLQSVSKPSTSSDAEKSSRHIKSHTGLRGVAALLVVGYHLQFGDGYRFSFEGHDSIFGRGYLWVDLFFILSGFIISFTNDAERKSTHSFNEIRTFLVHRFARIYPLHLFCLLYLLLWTVLRAAKHLLGSGPISMGAFGSEQLTALCAQIFLLNAWGPKSWVAWNVPSWSISAEAFSYLCFLPILWLHSKNAKACIALLLAIPGVFYGFVAIRTGDLDIVHGTAPIRCLAGFSLGMLAYYRRSVITRVSSPLLTGIQMVALSIVVTTLALGLNNVLIILPFFAIVWTTWTDNGALSNILERDIFQKLGDLSYSVYLNHVPLLTILSYFWNFFLEKANISPSEPILRPLYILLSLTLILAVAKLTFSFVEKPARKRIVRWGTVSKPISSAKRIEP